MGDFTFLGDVLSNPDGSPHAVTINPTGATRWYDCNTLVFEQMKLDFPNFDWSPYDLHKNSPNYEFDASITGPDSIVDYVIIVYRYKSGWAVQP